MGSMSWGACLGADVARSMYGWDEPVGVQAVKRVTAKVWEPMLHACFCRRSGADHAWGDDDSQAGFPTESRKDVARPETRMTPPARVGGGGVGGMDRSARWSGPSPEKGGGTMVERGNGVGARFVIDFCGRVAASSGEPDGVGQYQLVREHAVAGGRIRIARPIAKAGDPNALLKFALREARAGDEIVVAPAVALIHVVTMPVGLIAELQDSGADPFATIGATYAVPPRKHLAVEFKPDPAPAAGASTDPRAQFLAELLERYGLSGGSAPGGSEREAAAMPPDASGTAGVETPRELGLDRP